MIQQFPQDQPLLGAERFEDVGDVRRMQMVDLAPELVLVLAQHQSLHHVMSAHLGLVHQVAHLLLFLKQGADAMQAVVERRRRGHGVTAVS